MAFRKILIIWGGLFVFMGCKTPAKVVSLPAKTEPKMVLDSFALANEPPNSALLQELLAKLPAQFSPIIEHPETYKLQIIYTQIDRDAANQPFFKHHYFQVTDQYTYPASTVKLPASVLALEKLNRLGMDGLGTTTPMFTEGLRVGEKPVFDDPSSKTGKPSIGNYIKKVLLVSDNDANNRLYEFLGQEPFNKRLHGLGFTRAQITHRLSIPLSVEENRVTNPVWFMGTEGQTLYRQPFAKSTMEFATRNDSAGKGFMKTAGPGMQDELVNQPFDFSLKNRWPLKYAHQLTQWIMFPETQPDSNRLLLSASDYLFLWKYMSMFPGERDYPNYPAKDYWPAYVKYLWAGSEKGAWPDSSIRVFNKTGSAYGFLMDAAYIVDFDKKVEFMLSAVMYCNKDEILNDDRYDYVDVGHPFFKALGQTIFEYEKGRARKYPPDLTQFKITYTE